MKDADDNGVKFSSFFFSVCASVLVSSFRSSFFSSLLHAGKADIQKTSPTNKRRFVFFIIEIYCNQRFIYFLVSGGPK